jgi:tetratricopeptide (TPR) repeat protein
LAQGRLAARIEMEVVQAQIVLPCGWPVALQILLKLSQPWPFDKVERMTSHQPQNPNDLWVIHREEIETTQDGVCDVYAVLDAVTGHCFGMELGKILPTRAKLKLLIKNSIAKYNETPKALAILKSDPLAPIAEVACMDLKIQLQLLTKKKISPFILEFSNSFKKDMKGQREDALPEREQAEAFIPQSYDPCPCASGQKYKFCCQKIFKDVVNAMNAAQEGNLEQALGYMGEAEKKVGPTAEVLCRYGICWSFYDRKKSTKYFKDAVKANPNHPRTNYILGIESSEKKKYADAVAFYQKAIDHYPAEDKFHLNETLNNLGTAYFDMGNFQEAKAAWEKGLTILPSDHIVQRNLIEFIYNNPDVPKDIRTASPFIQKFLQRL